MTYASLGDPLWWTVANLLFPYPAAEDEGAAARNLARNRDCYPGLVRFVLATAQDGGLGRAARQGMSLLEAIDGLGTELRQE